MLQRESSSCGRSWPIRSIALMLINLTIYVQVCDSHLFVFFWQLSSFLGTPAMATLPLGFQFKRIMEMSKVLDGERDLLSLRKSLSTYIICFWQGSFVIDLGKLNPCFFKIHYPSQANVLSPCCQKHWIDDWRCPQSGWRCTSYQRNSDSMKAIAVPAFHTHFADLKDKGL